MKFTKKRAFLLVLIAIFLIVLLLVMKYIFITRPLKEELVSRAFDYIQLKLDKYDHNRRQGFHAQTQRAS